MPNRANIALDRLSADDIRIRWDAGLREWVILRAVLGAQNIVWRLTIQRETPGSPGVNWTYETLPGAGNPPRRFPIVGKGAEVGGGSGGNGWTTTYGGWRPTVDVQYRICVFPVAQGTETALDAGWISCIYAETVAGLGNVTPTPSPSPTPPPKTGAS